MFFYHAADQLVEAWAADDLPLGISTNITFESPPPCPLRAVDTLVLAIDGFFEWSDPTGRQYGIDRLQRFVAAHSHLPPKEFISLLHADVVEYSAGSPQPDDLTVVIVNRTVPTAGSVPDRHSELMSATANAASV